MIREAGRTERLQRTDPTFEYKYHMQMFDDQVSVLGLVLVVLALLLTNNSNFSWLCLIITLIKCLKSITEACCTNQVGETRLACSLSQGKTSSHKQDDAPREFSLHHPVIQITNSIKIPMISSSIPSHNLRCNNHQFG